MVTHDPVVARLADRRIELHHGKISTQEVFAMADEEQFDEVLEELWVLAEHGEIAEVEPHGGSWSATGKPGNGEDGGDGAGSFSATSTAGPWAQAIS